MALENYPLEQQYEIFLYGMQKVHPPDTQLAQAIAKRGKPALGYVLQMVAASNRDIDYVNSMQIFNAMVRMGDYSAYSAVCHDVEVAEEIEANEHKIASALLKGSYQLRLLLLKKECARRSGEERKRTFVPASR